MPRDHSNAVRHDDTLPLVLWLIVLILILPAIAIAVTARWRHLHRRRFDSRADLEVWIAQQRYKAGLLRTKKPD